MQTANRCCLYLFVCCCIFFSNEYYKIMGFSGFNKKIINHKYLTDFLIFSVFMLFSGILSLHYGVEPNASLMSGIGPNSTWKSGVGPNSTLKSGVRPFWASKCSILKKLKIEKTCEMASTTNQQNFKSFEKL